jgi:alpha-2-macroglobulin
MRPLKSLFNFLTVVITTLTAIVILLLPSLGHAKETGRYISVQQIDIDQTTSIAAGSEVNFLGVIDVTQSVAASGRFATFTYGGKIFNADADLFYKVRSDALISAHLSRTFDSGGSALAHAQLQPGPPA